MRIDALGQNTAEDVAPAIVGGDRRCPAFVAAAASAALSPLPPATVAEQIDAGVARESLGDRQPFWRRKGIDGLVRESRNSLVPAARAASASSAAQSSINTS